MRRIIVIILGTAIGFFGYGIADAFGSVAQEDLQYGLTPAVAIAVFVAGSALKKSSASK